MKLHFCAKNNGLVRLLHEPFSLTLQSLSLIFELFSLTFESFRLIFETPHFNRNLMQARINRSQLPVWAIERAQRMNCFQSYKVISCLPVRM
jgi:hypothetical protein